MRFVFAVIALLFLAPAHAAEWGTYANGRYGYVIGIPPDFRGLGESDNGDGQVFRSQDGSKTLTVWGGQLLAGDFLSEMEGRQKSDADQGWGLTYQAATPQWISYSGARNGLVLYARGIARCGDQYAMFRLEYSKQDIAKMDAVITKLVQTLKAGTC
ncbi:hypothetical protein GCM10011321_29980 [Youhaiella tibetensis]|uniref:Uncharacterized protein n=1 Tax=Paradevosia tibetensis TaxID=1447062 RepID=A0A5B9DIW3_9HYPH|nr:hypothetical protein [Youhaiella tibetensis]QEE19023.1 hypothetical protein FNA67_02000 [Youhaiella tibetensis]GGF36973.1 hypothetical protein GCM10011321_29980 [Youhaiella tibetensis]